MTHDTTLSAIGRRSSVLDRASLQANRPLTEVQALTDQLTSTFLQEATNLRTAAAMLGAGWVGRATRIGALSSLPGQTVLPQLVRGASYVPALAAESAAFAGIERGFHNLEGHPVSQPFQNDWARAAVALTALKGFGGLTRGQNVVLQHLTTDLGLVGGQHLAAAVGLTPRPQGSFAQQMLQAEATNLQMMGSLAFAHAASPGLSAMERSLDLYLHSQEGRLSSLGRTLSSSSPELVLAAEGSSSSLSSATREAEDITGPSTVFMSVRPKTGMDPITGAGDPVEGRGTFVQGGGALGGGNSAKRLSKGDLTRIFRGDEPPVDAHALSQLVERHDLMDALSKGGIFVALEDTSSSSLPTTYSLSLIPASHTEVLRTLLNVNETAAWMPRLEWFRTVGDDVTKTFQSRPISQRVDGRFMVARPLIFQGRFLFDFRTIPGGAQMSWALNGPQDFPDKGVKQMRINNSSFTLQVVPNRPDQTLLAHSIHVEPDSVFLRGGLAMFLPGAHKNELPQFMNALANRSLVPIWTLKDKDPTGLDLSRGTNPSNMRWRLIDL